MMGQKASAQELAEEVVKLVEDMPQMADLEAAAKAVIEKATKKEAAPVVVAAAAALEGPGAQTATSMAAADSGKPKLSHDMVKAKILELAASVVADGEGVEQDIPFMEAGID